MSYNKGCNPIDLDRDQTPHIDLASSTLFVVIATGSGDMAAPKGNKFAKGNKGGRPTAYRRSLLNGPKNRASLALSILR
jgi:hypothetical protein